MPVQYLPWADTVERSQLQEALVEDDTAESREFLTRLSDPLQMDLPISTLAQRSGIRVPRLMEIWRCHMKVAAMGVALARAPLVARDTVQDALTQIVCCTRCDGAGTMRIVTADGPSWITCKTCQGSGEIRKPGDAKSREWVLRAAGVIAAESSPVTIINNQQNTGAVSVLDDLDRFERGGAVTVVAIPEDDA